jgi:hypothetical protein
MVTRFWPRLLFSCESLVESMVCSIASPIDDARVPSTEVQALQPSVVIRSSVIQSRPGRLTFIPSVIFVLLHPVY